MSLASVRSKILVTLSAVAGITGGAAKVHDYLRLAQDEMGAKTLFDGAARRHVWMISLGEADPFITENPGGQPGRGIAQEFGRYTFNLHGFYAHKDADGTEKVFQDLVEDVVDAFRADKKLGNAVIDSGPLQWVEYGFRFLPKEGGALCHYARLVLRVKEQTG